ncbi:hypothetical protein OIV83_000602 [Microbotryomycetes sp. JL201]|nr:hypothetical protein OIV83_000602 [Microbotryomycetes sp. JL201]
MASTGDKGGSHTWPTTQAIQADKLSQQTACEDSDGATHSEANVVDKMEKGDVPTDVIWVEWEPNDPENPYNGKEMDDDMDQLHVHAAYGETSYAQFRPNHRRLTGNGLQAFTGSAFAMGTESMMRDLNCSLELATLALSA